MNLNYLYFLLKCIISNQIKIIKYVCTSKQMKIGLRTSEKKGPAFIMQNAKIKSKNYYN